MYEVQAIQMETQLPAGEELCNECIGKYYAKRAYRIANNLCIRGGCVKEDPGMTNCYKHTNQMKGWKKSKPEDEVEDDEEMDSEDDEGLDDAPRGPYDNHDDNGDGGAGVGGFAIPHGAGIQAL
ncbi:hypothetical protein QBC44DRAFT_375675 [Cladorrhinum sp. PSN332]|nr:hypothetical protein QBC44DRAFT_375675 [Cladorrhinum sp. PSN332]